MRFATVKKKGKVFVGAVENGHVFHLREIQKAMEQKVTLPMTMIECIEAGVIFVKQASEMVAWAREKTQPIGRYDIGDVTFLAPIVRPRKNIVCVAGNYTNDQKAIVFFTKAPTAVIGQGEHIHRYPQLTEQLDYEGELAIVIGKKGKSIPKEEALQYVFGYTIVNDVTARDVQSRHKQFFLGKSFDTFCPMGPVIVHHTAISHPERLQIETKVNGEVRQRAYVEEMRCSIADIISTLSQGMTLEPGDVIATGTPSGVGKGMNPPVFLQKGDRVTVEITEIGTLHNTVK